MSKDKTTAGMTDMEAIIGIDFSKEKFDATLIICNGLEKCKSVHAQFKNDLVGYRRALSWVSNESQGLNEGAWLFCGEATGNYSLPLQQYLVGKGIPVWIEDPYKIKHSRGLERCKDDKSDSAAIAEYAMRYGDRYHGQQNCGSNVNALKMLQKQREILVEQRKKMLAVRKENSWLMERSASIEAELGEQGDGKTESAAARRIVGESVESLITTLDASIKDIEKHIASLVEKTQIKENFTFLTSITGIGPVTASALIVATNNFAKYDLDYRKMACYIGIAPFGAQSGTSLKTGKHISPHGNKRLKGLFSEVALCAIKHNPAVRTYYNGLKARNKPTGVALNNVKNKMLKTIVALIRKKECFKTNYKIQTS